MARILTVTEAARNFSDVVNRAFYRGESALLVRSGQPMARIVPLGPEPVTGKELAALWPSMPHLTRSEADQFAVDIEKSRRELNRPPRTTWD